jgi:hypothetical protein
MTSSGRKANDSESSQLAIVAGLVIVVALQPAQEISYQMVGPAIRSVLARESTDGQRDLQLTDGEVDQLAAIPVRFTVRDGWSSPQLRRHLQDACALGALVIGTGGVVRLGPSAQDFSRRAKKPQLVSVRTSTEG